MLSKKYHRRHKQETNTYQLQNLGWWKLKWKEKKKEVKAKLRSEYAFLNYLNALYTQKGK